jgi:hypothetical protein
LANKTLIEARKYIGAFYLKIYVIILVGLLWGVQSFPANALVIYAGLLFFLQLAVVFQQNKRIFPNFTVHFSMSACKVIFCVSS